MLKWTFDFQLEKDLKDAAENIYSIMKKHDLSLFIFHLYGFNHLELEITSILGNYEITLIDEDAYTPHFLEGEEYAAWKKKQEEKERLGFSYPFDIHFDCESNEKLNSIISDLISFWIKKRKNDLNWMEFEVEEKRFLLDYDEKKNDFSLCCLS